MSYQELRKALLNKLNITRQALYERCKSLKKQVPMTTEDAVCVIAQRAGIILDKYVDVDTISRIRALITQLSPATPPPSDRTLKKRDQSAKQYVISIGKDFRLTDPILSSKVLLEASEMSTVYSHIYVLENSVREFIDRVMTDNYGKDWWDSQAPSELRKDVKKRMSEDQRDSWHQKRGARPIDYLDLKDLPRLVSKIQHIVVPAIIPSYDWFKLLIEELYKSRCVVCHMNPLDKNNVKAVEVRFTHWEKQISKKKSQISNKPA